MHHARVNGSRRDDRYYKGVGQAPRLVRVAGLEPAILSAIVSKTIVYAFHHTRKLVLLRGIGPRRRTYQVLILPLNLKEQIRTILKSYWDSNPDLRPDERCTIQLRYTNSNPVRLQPRALFGELPFRPPLQEKSERGAW